MYLTLKDMMVKLDCDYQQILQMVANGKLQPFYINEALVPDAKAKALLIVKPQRKVAEAGTRVLDAKEKALLIINPHHADNDYYDHHRMNAEEEAGVDWYFKESLLLIEKRAVAILEAIEILGFDRMKVTSKQAVMNTVGGGELFPAVEAFEGAWKHGNRQSYWKYFGG